MRRRRVFLIVLDSVGCGALPDAAEYGDAGANTLAHVAEAVGGLSLPNLERLGLGCVTAISGLSCARAALGTVGRLAEMSPGKDTTTGHWEMAGLVLTEPFPTYPSGFPPEVMARFSEVTGYGWLGNVPASGTEIIARLGLKHIETGKPIVYTSADSVFQIAAHEDVVPVQELYRVCEAVRSQVMVGEHAVARVIARPFEGSAETGFTRTARRHDYSLEPPTATALDVLVSAGVPVYGVGKISDIFAGRGVTLSRSTASNGDGMDAVRGLADTVDYGLVFANLVDFDMAWGHRRDAVAYGAGLQEVDRRIGEVLGVLGDGDLLVVTADHGCDPTWAGSDHTREYVPLLAVTGSQLQSLSSSDGSAPGARAADVGTRSSLADVGATVLAWFGLDRARGSLAARPRMGEYSWAGSVIPLTYGSAHAENYREPELRATLDSGVCAVMSRLQVLVGDTEDVYLVGGLVRDALQIAVGTPRSTTPGGELDAPLRPSPDTPAPNLDIDLVLVGDLDRLLTRLIAEGHYEVVARNLQLMTARVLDVQSGRSFDIAEARVERYSSESAYPAAAVSAPIEWDLARRDFTVNALAVACSAVDDTTCSFSADAVVDLFGGIADLRAGLLRVLHDDSFEDDPTRVVRMVRFSRRLGLQPEPHTLALASAALAGGALDRVADKQRAREFGLLLEEWKAGLSGE